MLALIFRLRNDRNRKRHIARGKVRVSQHYNLGRTQATMDFVDVDIIQDTPVFLSPKALTMLPSEFGDECVHLVQNFFHTVLENIRAGENLKAERLLRELREPNETRLGLSKGKARGRALGSGSAHDVWQSLSRSEAAKTGLIEAKCSLASSREAN
jgi:hypothetical protein